MLTRETCPSKTEDAVLDVIYLLDDIAPSNIQFAFSLRKLKSSYTGSCLQVRRASDNTTLDIGFAGDYVDLNAISNFCGTSQGFITTWYDQSGNAQNVSQGTASAQPIIYDGNFFTYTTNVSGNIVIAPYYDGSNDQLNFISAPSINNYSLYASVRVSNTWYNSGFGGILTNGGSGDIWHYSGSLGYCWFNGAYNVLFPKASAINGLQTITYIHNNTSSIAEGYQNRTIGNSGSVASLSQTRGSIMGNWAGLPLQGHLPEIIAFDGVQTSTVRTNVQSNMSQFTNEFPSYKFLDVYPNAFVAFSLRKLRTGYTGNAIRVRRSSDNTELNIGFDGQGNLNVEQLTNFCGTGDGFVVTWYNQVSPAATNLIQATASRQPQIVFSGAIIYDNGKPAVYYSRSNESSMYTAGNVSVSGNICSIFVNNTDKDVLLSSSMTFARLGSWGGSSGYAMIPRFDGSAYDWDINDSAFMGSGYVSGTSPRMISETFSTNPLYQGTQSIVISRLGTANFLYRNGEQMTPLRVSSAAALPSYTDALNIGFVGETYQGTIQEIIYYKYAMTTFEANDMQNLLNNYYNAY